MTVIKSKRTICIFPNSEPNGRVMMNFSFSRHAWLLNKQRSHFKLQLRDMEPFSFLLSSSKVGISTWRRTPRGWIRMWLLRVLTCRGIRARRDKARDTPGGRWPGAWLWYSPWACIQAPCRSTTRARTASPSGSFSARRSWTPGTVTNSTTLKSEKKNTKLAFIICLGTV